ncbi:hypothetical protein FHY55_01035 [Oceanicola sp. D3]|uniref:hypothetical protein n=1 Tax=Oceanicola sp. D3 TaxID=2587163 RepID=UPI00111D2883|nr:hypothetical protein [Oceanicola sp. D3]QDC07913.1 hypothetical protein FHY55_01035 [Oceanicola sp. D3]
MWVKQLLYGLFLAFVVALPSALALGYYKITGDPTFRPLAQSIERVVFRGEVGEARDLQVQLRLHDPSAADGLRMARQIRRSFSAKGIDARVYVLTIPEGERAGVIFRVHSNRLGPYPLSRASEGIQAAVSAYRMTVRAAAE